MELHTCSKRISFMTMLHPWCPNISMWVTVLFPFPIQFFRGILLASVSMSHLWTPFYRKEGPLGLAVHSNTLPQPAALLSTLLRTTIRTFCIHMAPISSHLHSQIFMSRYNDVMVDWVCMITKDPCWIVWMYLLLGYFLSFLIFSRIWYWTFGLRPHGSSNTVSGTELLWPSYSAISTHQNQTQYRLPQNVQHWPGL